MSELIQTEPKKALLRQLLATGSTISLLAAMSASGTAAATEDGDRPTAWIELGGQLEAINGQPDTYVPPFVAANVGYHENVVLPLGAQRQSGSAFGGEGKFTLAPAGSDWVFSAAVRYGRSNGKKNIYQTTLTKHRIQTAKYAVNHKFVTQTFYKFVNSQVKYSTTHTLVDFMAGRDVGLGMFGRNASSVFSAGVRIAQFTNDADMVFHSKPYLYEGVDAGVHPSHLHFYDYYAHARIDRSFRGVGPSISWNGSAPFLGNHDAGEVTADWGANAAILFGRQKVRGTHETTGHYNTGIPVQQGGMGGRSFARTVPLNRSHSAVVPNVGGFAGISVKYPNAKFSLGYRADFFFNAMDEGIDTRNSSTEGFHGPFATFAVGFGG